MRPERRRRKKATEAVASDRFSLVAQFGDSKIRIARVWVRHDATGTVQVLDGTANVEQGSDEAVMARPEEQLRPRTHLVPCPAFVREDESLNATHELVYAVSKLIALQRDMKRAHDATHSAVFIATVDLPQTVRDALSEPQRRIF